MATRYQTIGLLADGGMAEICLGRCSDDNTLVAIKRIKPPFDRHPDFLAMFEDEGRLWQRLRHPNIVRILCAESDDDGPFIAMELVDGLDLATILQRQRGQALPVAFALSVATALCDALAYLHAVTDEAGAPLGLVHRDVSPGNVLCGRNGDIKLTDFGVAQASIKTHQTRVGDLKGKFAYMSPEQTRGEALTPHSDLFSTGVVLWETLAGKSLFDRETDVDTAQAVRSADIPPLRSLRADVSPELEGALGALLARDPSLRPTAEVAASELRRIGRSAGLVLGASATSAVLSQLVAAADGPEKRAAPPIRRRTRVAPLVPGADRRRLWPQLAIGASLLVALALAVGGYRLLAREPADPAAQPSADASGLLRAPDAGLVASAGDVVPSDAAAAIPTAPLPDASRRDPSVHAWRPPPTTSPRGRDGGAAVASGYGILDLNSEPWAQIAIDGVPINRNTPLRDFAVAAGRHRLTLHNPVFKITRTIVVEVKPGERLRQVVDLTAETHPPNARRSQP
ncbi:MAG: protein kinase [Deltaproteobacteria bacterium]|nr:protein kinase [Deltaproteobacteria bacterium]